MEGHGHRIPSLRSVSSLLTVLHPAIRRELIRFRWFRKVNAVENTRRIDCVYRDEKLV